MYSKSTFRIAKCLMLSMEPTLQSQLSKENKFKEKAVPKYSAAEKPYSMMTKISL